ncbi:hypothetical protein ACFPK9_01100 [Rubritalea spongiae]|uniref:Uncharacterized protein n=1 Tax=Rubritalea spongiae TaxID=430797 RepID=A0ABW5E0M0_9BACT
MNTPAIQTTDSDHTFDSRRLSSDVSRACDNFLKSRGLPTGQEARRQAIVSSFRKRKQTPQKTAN